MNMTLEQVRYEISALNAGGSYIPHGSLSKWADAIDSHLARQSEGVSEETVRHLEWVRDITSDPNMVLTKAELARVHRYASAALTAVWHNRPAQEDLDGFVDAVAAYKEIGELLAVIHADGGHYKDAHGFKKAAVDAKEIVWAMKGQLNNRPAQEPPEGHSVRVMSSDGDWEGEARWEYQESAYVTQQAVRAAQEKATNYVSGRMDSIGKFHATEQEKAAPVADDGRFYVEARQCEDCDHLGINDSSDTFSACSDCEWQGPTPDEDKCPGCAHQNCMAVACPICGGRYRFLADRWFEHDTASPAERVRVPDGDHE